MANNKNSAIVINNVAYSWAMVQLSAPQLTGGTSTVLNGVSGIKYEIKQKVETNYGLGGEPINRGFGNVTYSASLTMDYNTQVQLRALCGSLRNLGEFDLTVSFAGKLGTAGLSDQISASGVSAWTTEVILLKGCIFTEDGLDVKQDDTNITREFDLNPFKIELGEAGKAGNKK